MMRRRVFLKNGSLAVGLSMIPGFLYRTVEAAAAADRDKVLVVIFQRGGLDGLNCVVPFGDKAYYEHRPGIAIPAPGADDGALDLDGFYGLNPALAPLVPLYKSGRLAIVNAVGSPDTGGRSHFQAQDFMESAAPGNKTISTGWLNRYLQLTPGSAHTPLRATAIGESLPKALRGPAAALTIGQGDAGVAAAEMYESMYSHDANALLTGTAREMFDAMKQLKGLKPAGYQPAAGVNYGSPQGIGGALMQIAQLIKANVGLQVAFVDVTGFDTHQGEAARLPPLLRTLGQALAGFNRDLGDRMEDVVVLTMSEFGRTARENGNGGTDHGHANMMFLMGGSIKGGKTYGKWPGLAKEQLNEDRDLALTTDFRDVLAEVLVRHLHCEKAQGVFPGYAIEQPRFKGMI